ncbi:hypothetical protein LWI28_020632 [Acer negundo]|uniref:Uncharacterized protein n=1 Tax=Acer negundo TaxID=4023 RepID=A0AAD5IGC2_ACENE|nr:hypothetical protein LWI28_020632 [Acer negundo]
MDQLRLGFYNTGKLVADLLRDIPFWEKADMLLAATAPLTSLRCWLLLKPALLYTEKMYLNGEVEPCPLCGLKYCIFGMFEGRHVQDLISQQLQKYEHGEAEWWSRYGAQCPELQKLAIRIPSQTCDGILGFDLKRSLAEELLSRKKTTNQIDYEYLLDTTYVQCNVQLQNTKSKALSDLYVSTEEADPMDD